MRATVKTVSLLVLLVGWLGAATAMAASPAGAGYRLAPEDVLHISVWKEKDLTQDCLVLPDGHISFPLAGSIQAAGKTAQQVQAELVKRIAKYIPTPVVSVSVTSVAGNKIYVIGKVNKPGMFPMGTNVDVMQALAMAGGLNPYAKEGSIEILRREGGKQVAYPFDYSDVADGSDLSQNIMLRTGDVVVVR